MQRIAFCEVEGSFEKRRRGAPPKRKKKDDGEFNIYTALLFFRFRPTDVYWIVHRIILSFVVSLRRRSKPHASYLHLDFLPFVFHFFTFCWFSCIYHII